MWGTGSLVRKAMLKNAGQELAQPPGWVAAATAPGRRYWFVAGSQRPTPASIRTTDVPGFHAAWGTRTSNWRRVMSTETLGEGVRALPVVASVSTAVVPCTVRNRCAGDTTPALNGQASAVAESPRAIVNATRLGSLNV